MSEDQFATYDDYLSMADDRDDRDDIPSHGDASDYCPHGMYVGGCGIDRMCPWCEDGTSVSEARRIVARERLVKIRERADNAARALNTLLKARHVDDDGTVHIVKGSDAQYLAQQTSYIGNPLSRYGRH
jgi:hypothetical protein